MMNFASLEDALANASGVTRLREEALLLHRLVDQGRTHLLDGLIPALGFGDAAVLESIRHLIATQGEAANCISDEPWTLERYNGIAGNVAKLLEKKWAPIGEINPEAMEELERRLTPEYCQPQGLNAVQGWAKQLEDGLPNDAALAECSTAVKRAKANLDQRAGEARKAAPLEHDESEPATAKDWADRCQRVAEELKGVIEGLQKRRTAIDQLAALRNEAREFLEATETNDCPVCQQQIDRQRLIETLGKAGDDDATGPITSEIGEKKSAQDACQTAAESVTDALASLNRENEKLTTQVTQSRECIGEFSKRAANQDWSDSVKTQLEQLKTLAADEAAKLPDDVAREQEVDRVGTVIRKLRDALQAWLALQEEEANRAIQQLDPARRMHGKLAPLRRVLVAAKALNELDWLPTWEEQVKQSRIEAQVALWKAAANELIKDREEEASSATDAVLADQGVCDRFMALLDNVNHPLLKNVSLKPHGIPGVEEVRPRNAGPRRLSEGYRVIVNLAAFISMGGYVVPGQSHQAGWVVLDEPTNGLDEGHRCTVANYLGGLREDLMPRQMFVLTFEKQFAETLKKAAVDSGRAVCEVNLPDWTGPLTAAPAVTVVQSGD
jgi:hypothetical protein